MKKRIIASLLSLVMLITLLPITVLTAVSVDATEIFGTDRTSEEVEAGRTYTISNQDELGHFAALSNSGDLLDYSGVTILLTQNITITKDYDLSSVGNWKPVNVFRGIFDGGNFTVTINCNNFADTGFICLNYGKIENLTISGTVSHVNSFLQTYCGGIAGHNYGTITNCTNAATISSDNSCGGIAGYNNDIIVNCSNTATVSGHMVGGIAGESIGTIMDCSNTAAVNGIKAGGIAGGNFGTILNCYNTEIVSGTLKCGGIAGGNNDTIINCYNTGAVRGDEDTIGGGIAGGNSGTIMNCFNTATVSSTTCGGIVGEVGYATLKNCYWLESVATNSMGGNLGSVTTENIVSFDAQGVLQSAVDGETSLLKVLNNWVVANQTGTTEYSGWNSGTVYPVLSSSPVVLTDSLSGGTIGTPYSVSLSTISGYPVDWYLESGTLPNGLALSNNGTINGTPTFTGEFTFTLRAESSAGSTTKSYTIMISKFSQSSLTLTGVPASVTYGDEPFTVGTSGGNGTGKVKFSIVNQTDLSGAAATGIASVNADTGMVTILKAGKFQISAIKEGDGSYSEGTSVTTETLTVNKKTDYTVPSGLTATAGKTLGNIALTQPANGVFTWESGKDTPVGNPGNNTFKLTFTPKDTVNYNTVTGIEVTVTVRQSDIVQNTDNHDKTSPKTGDSTPILTMVMIILLSLAAGILMLQVRKDSK